MRSQSMLQLRAVILRPTPDGCVVDVETALLQQFLNIAQRKRIAKIPPDGTKDETGFGLPPFEDRGLGSHFTILSRHQPATLKVATHPSIGMVACVNRVSMTVPVTIRHEKWTEAGPFLVQQLTALFKGGRVETYLNQSQWSARHS